MEFRPQTSTSDEDNDSRIFPLQDVTVVSTSILSSSGSPEVISTNVSNSTIILDEIEQSHLIDPFEEMEHVKKVSRSCDESGGYINYAQSPHSRIELESTDPEQQYSPGSSNRIGPQDKIEHTEQLFNSSSSNKYCNNPHDSSSCVETYHVQDTTTTTSLKQMPPSYSSTNFAPAETTIQIRSTSNSTQNDKNYSKQIPENPSTFLHQDSGCLMQDDSGYPLNCPVHSDQLGPGFVAHDKFQHEGQDLDSGYPDIETGGDNETHESYSCNT